MHQIQCTLLKALCGFIYLILATIPWMKYYYYHFPLCRWWNQGINSLTKVLSQWTGARIWTQVVFTGLHLTKSRVQPLAEEFKGCRGEIDPRNGVFEGLQALKGTQFVWEASGNSLWEEWVGVLGAQPWGLSPCRLHWGAWLLSVRTGSHGKLKQGRNTIKLAF